MANKAAGASSSQQPPPDDAGLEAAAAATGHHPSAFGDISSPHTLPPPILRLLALSSPLINGIHELLQLATWTGPRGGGTRSSLLLLAWTGLCLFAYPILRYCPQVLVLAVVLLSAVPRVLLPSKAGAKTQGSKNSSATTPGTSFAAVPTFNRATLTQTQTVELLSKLSDILDVCSTLHAKAVLPIWQILTWSHPAGPSITIGTAVLSLTLGSIWTLCFLDWPTAWGTVTTLLPLSGIKSLYHRGSAALLALSLSLYNSYVRKHVEQHVPPIVQTYIIKAYAFHLALTSRLPAFPTAVPLTVLPPFPLFSLSLSNVVLTLGLLGLSWCSTYASLVRYALWKSATIRRATRSALRLFSVGYLGGPGASDLARTGVSLGGPGATVSDARVQTTTLKGSSSQTDPKTTRINHVAYRFELFENQRWWMGLDWTAALLPQERASWTDDNLSPVSPPSSFTLPAETVTMKPAPTKEKPNAWEKRTVRWKWEEEEWRVIINASSGGGAAPGSPTPAGAGDDDGASRRDSFSTLKGSTLFSAFQKTSESSAFATPSESQEGPSTPPPSSPFPGGGDESGEDDDSYLYRDPTDASGWRYGDNAWEKMDKKSGMGKYTRRRRWVRKARMDEIVEGGLDAPSPSDVKRSSSGTRTSNDKDEDTDEPVEVVSKKTAEPIVEDVGEKTAVDPALPTSSSATALGDSEAPMSPRSDLKSRLASAGKGK